MVADQILTSCFIILDALHALLSSSPVVTNHQSSLQYHFQDLWHEKGIEILHVNFDITMTHCEANDRGLRDDFQTSI
jgi:hypothetical protein